MNFLRISFALLAVAVICGAFGAHALKEKLAPEQLEVWKTAVLYHFIHAIGLLLISILMEQKILLSRARIAQQLLLAGIILFSGSLYLLSTKDVLGISSWSWLGPLTPLGGLCFLAGWTMCIFSVTAKPKT